MFTGNKEEREPEKETWKEGPGRGETEDCGYQEGRGRACFPEEGAIGCVSAPERSCEMRTEKWQEIGKRETLATLPHSFCGVVGGGEIWGENGWTDVETENKDLSLDTQSWEGLENRMIFVREEELDGV